MKMLTKGQLALASLLIVIGGHANAALIRMTPLGVAVDEQVVLDPVPIGADGFRLSYWGGGTDALLDPVLLIFATPDGATPGLTVTSSNPASLSTTPQLGGTNVYGGTWNTVTGAAGTYDQTTSSPNLSVYEYIGLTPKGSDSENYPNWSSASGLTSWSLFVYKLTFNPDFNHGDWVEFSTTNLVGGSFVVGYGCTTLSTSGSGLCKNAGTTESTPFTFAGMVKQVPEPGTLSLLGAGLLIIGFAGRRRPGATHS
jgi:PEP-CTERM motif